MITEASLLHLRSLPDQAAAEALDQRLRELEAIWKRSFVERGLILLEVQQRLLWKSLTDPNTQKPYTSFERWVLTAAPQSRSDAYAALGAVKELRDIPREHLEAIPRCNVNLLRKVSTAVRTDPEVLKVAQYGSLLALTRKIIKDHPGQHLEEPGRGVVDQAVALAIQLEDGCDTRDDVIRFWAIEYLNSHQMAETNEP